MIASSGIRHEVEMTNYRRSLAVLAALLATCVSAAAADTAKGGQKPQVRSAANASTSSQVAQATAKRPLVLPANGRPAAVIIHGIQY